MGRQIRAVTLGEAEGERDKRMEAVDGAAGRLQDELSTVIHSSILDTAADARRRRPSATAAVSWAERGSGEAKTRPIVVSGAAVDGWRGGRGRGRGLTCADVYVLWEKTSSLG